MPTTKTKNIYQLKISLKDIEPLIWRGIEVPEDFTFWDLHMAIQDAMGWENCHLFEFRIKKDKYSDLIRISIPDQYDTDDILASWNTPIKDYLELNQIIDYIYDLGDNWEHEIVLEKINPKDKDKKYPLCINGDNDCPPEDCGGLPGYLELISKKKKGNTFNPKKVKFQNSKQILRALLKDI